MAITRVQYKQVYGDGVTSVNLTFDSPVTAGSLLLMGCSIYYNAGAPRAYTVADNNGNSWTEIHDINYDGNDVGGMAYALNANSGSTQVTVSGLASGSFISMVIVEVSGVETASVLDQQNSADSAGSTWDSGNITTTQADEYLFGVLALDNGNRTLTEDGAWTLIYEQQNGNSFMPISTGERIVSSTLTESWSGTIGTSSQFYAGIASFKGAASGPADNDVSVSEAASVADTGTAKVSDPQVATPAEAASVADTPVLSVQPTDTPQVSASEAVTVADTPAVSLPDALKASAAEAISVADTATASLPDALAVSAAEAVTVADTGAAEISAIEDVNISAAEAVTVADTPVVDVSDPQVNTSLATYITDTFTDTDTTPLASHTPDVGGTWTVQSGAFAINGNLLTSSTAGIATIDSGQTNKTISIEYRMAGATAVFGIVFRWTDANNYWVAQNDNRDNSWTIQQIASGTPTVRDSGTFGPVTNTWYTMTVSDNGTVISAKIDGANELTYSSATGASSVIGVRHALITNAITNDNLSVISGSELSESVTVTDSPTVSISALGDIDASAAEAVTVADSPTVAVSDPQVSAAEAVTVADSPAVSVQATTTPQVSASEAVGVTDTCAVDVSDPQITAAEAVGVTDTPQVSILVEGTIYASASEAVSVADSAALVVSDPQVSAAEAIGVADSATADVSDPQVSAAEDVTIADSASLVITAQADLSIVASEAVSVADSPTAAMGDLQAASSEAVSVADSGSTVISAVADLLVSAIENVTVADSPTMGGLLIALTVAQSISVADSATIVMPGLTLLDVALTDAVVTSLLLSDSVTTNLSLSDSVVTNLALSDKTR